MEKIIKDALLKKISRLEKKIDSYREKLRQTRIENQALSRKIRDQGLILKEFPGWLILIQKGEILFTNNKLLTDLGYKENEVLERPFEAFIHEDSLDYVKKIHKKRLSGEVVPDIYELNLKTKTGQKIPCEARISKIRYHGRKAFVVGLTSLERRRGLEKKMIEEEKHRLICSVSSGLAIELRTCTEILANCLTNARSRNFSSKQFLHQLQGVHKHQQKIVTLLEQLGQAQRRHQSVIELPIIIREAIEAAREISSSDLSDHPSPVEIKTFFRTSSLVKVDPDALRTGITCVISNAIEACSPEGTILVTLEETPGLAHIYVQDNGPGIPIEEHERVFEPFYTTKNNHLGLGLTVASAVFRMHRGKIELSSRPGHGAFFSLMLPTTRKASRVKLPPPGKALKHKRIMILGEDDLIGGLVSELLISKGAQILAAHNQHKAMKLVAKGKIDLIVAHLQSAASEIIGVVTKATEIRPGLPVICTLTHGKGDQSACNHTTLGGRKNVVFLSRPINMAHFLVTATRLVTPSPETLSKPL